MPAHKREISKADEAEIIKYALVGCYDKTIARLTGIPETTLKRRCGDLIAKKRAERKYNLRVAQDKAVTAGNSALLIFLGKNELGQVDKQERVIDMGEETIKTVLGIINGCTKGKLPSNDPRDSSETP